MNEKNKQDFCLCPNQCEIVNILKKLSEQKNSLNDWIDSQDLMHILHLSKRTLQALRTNGTIPFSRINNKIYYKIEDIQQILQDNYKMYKIESYGNRK